MRQTLVETVLDILPRRNSGGRRPTMRDFNALDWAKVEEIILDVRVDIIYRRVRSFQLGKLTDKPIRDIYCEFDAENGGGQNRMSIPEYYKRKYNIDLLYVDLPGISPVNRY